MKKKIINLATIKSTLLAVFASLILTAFVNAATYTVNTVVDNTVPNGCTTNTNGCTLREAILDANATPDDDIINFNVASATIVIGTPTRTQFVIENNGSLTINGPGANNLIISGNNASTVFEIKPGAVVNISGLKITGGRETSFGGGIYNQGGNLTLTNTIVSDNTSPLRNGGGIFNGCPVGCVGFIPTLTMVNSTVSNNTAGNGGGGIYNVTPLTQARNVVTLTNTTVSNNSAGNIGGGIYTFQATLNMESVTVSNNSAGRQGGGVLNRQGTMTANNTIFANSTTQSIPGDDCNGAYGINNITYSIIESNFACVNPRKNLTTVIGDPNLGPLQNNGGQTPTHALLPGSIAGDKGNSALTTDQRGLNRPVDDPDSANGAGNLADIGAFEVQFNPNTFLVNSTADPGNGTCDAGECTLREAIAAANSSPLDNVINFDPAVFNVARTITINTGGSPAQTRFIIANNGSLTINGTGANILSISGNNATSVFELNIGAKVQINNLTIKNGRESQTFGGGIYNQGGNLTLTNTVVSDNVSPARNGGGIFNGCPVGCAGFTPTLNIVNSTVSNNTAGNGGGAISNAGLVTINNTTISGNQAGGPGGAISNPTTNLGAFVTISNSTLSNNSAGGVGGGVNNVAGSSLYIFNTILANNTSTASAATGDCFNSGAGYRANYSLFGVNNGCAVNSGASSNNITGDPNLGPLQDNGGPTPTHALLAGSIAIDKGFSTESADQRGYSRPIDLSSITNAANGNGTDIGAFEFQVAATVNSTADPGDGTCNLAECTLREAIAVANASPEDDIITFSLQPSSVVTLNGTQLQIANNGSLTIDGKSASKLTISGNNLSRVFAIASGANVTMDRITVSSGKATGSTGGGILIQQGTLTLNDSTVSGNSAQFGGGIFNFNGNLTLNRSTVMNNTVTNGGGGIYNEGNGLLNNSTISGNTAGSGGGLENFNNTLTINSSTFAKNRAAIGGGTVFNSGNGTLTLNNSIIADSITGSDCLRGGGTINASYSQIEGGLTCVNGTNSNNQINDPALAPLGFFGGYTQTHALTINSTAIDRGNSFGLTTDQRGFNRPIDLAGFTNGSGNAADIGASEIQTSELVATSTGTSIVVSPSSNSQPFAESNSELVTVTNDVSVTFSAVTASGVTSFVPIDDPLSVGTPPAGYSILQYDTGYDISTTATVTAPITVCFYIDSVNDATLFSRVRILHGENDALVDRTILSGINAPNFADRSVCAEVNSLSPFVAALFPPTGTGVEGDVSVRPTGDGSVLSDDVVMIRRFINGSLTPDLVEDNEFQRADVAPLATNGDGQLLSDDLIQIRRYATGTTPSQVASGPYSPLSNFAEFASSKKGSAQLGSAIPRVLTVQNSSGSRDNNVVVNLLVDANGDEAAYAFRINYDPSVLTYVSNSLGTVGGTRSCNTAVLGRVTCTVDGFPNNLPTSTDADIGEIAAGAGQLMISFTFTIRTDAPFGASNVTLSNFNTSSDAPTLLAIAGQNGTVTVLAPTAANVSVSGRVMTTDGRGLRNAIVTLTDSNGEVRTVRTGTFGYYRFNDIAAGQNVVISIVSKQYQFAPRVVNVTEDIEDLNFTASKSNL